MSAERGMRRQAEKKQLKKLRKQFGKKLRITSPSMDSRIQIVAGYLDIPSKQINEILSMTNKQKIGILGNLLDSARKRYAKEMGAEYGGSSAI